MLNSLLVDQNNQLCLSDLIIPSTACKYEKYYKYKEKQQEEESKGSIVAKPQHSLYHDTECTFLSKF